MSGRFDGRTALVTGGASGIGRATVDRLAAEGARVVAADVNAELLERLADSANADAVVPVAADISTEAGAVTLIGSALEALGHLDVLVNAAGILAFAHTVDHSLSDWERVLAVNLTGTFLMCRQALPSLLTTQGNIVNVASVAGHRGQPWAAAYVASKGGVLALTRMLAVEFALRGVRVNSVSPGAIDTPMSAQARLPDGAELSLLSRVVPLGPFGSAEGVAAAIAYIASDEAAHLNGADLVLDGATIA